MKPGPCLQSASMLQEIMIICTVLLLESLWQIDKYISLSSEYGGVSVDGAEQEERGGAAEAATWSGRSSDPQRVTDLSAAQETAGLRQRDVRPAGTATEGQTEVSSWIHRYWTAFIMCSLVINHVRIGYVLVGITTFCQHALLIACINYRSLIELCLILFIVYDIVFMFVFMFTVYSTSIDIIRR